MLRRLVASNADTEADGECELDNDESKLDKETDEQDAVFATVEDSDAKVLDANQNGTNHVSSTEGESIGQLGVGCIFPGVDMTHMNRAMKPSCIFGWRSVSKTASRIRPAAPAIAKKMERIAHVLSNLPLFEANWLECRSHRSERKAKSRKTTVTTLPPTNSGFKCCAPTSEIYL